MAGIMTGFFGFQRSGKTALAVYLSRLFQKRYNIRVYTNMDVDGFLKIYSLNDLPFDFEPKIVLLDEVNFFFDSRSWKKNTDDINLFFNTVGKQNMCLMLTCPRPDMLEKRLREQLNYVFISKALNEYICYRFFDVQRQKQKDFKVLKTKEFFDFLDYNTQHVPDFVDTGIDAFVKKVKDFNKQNRKQK